MKRIIRDRLLTAEEASKYDTIRQQIEQEKPEISERIRKRIFATKDASVKSTCEDPFDNIAEVANTLGVSTQDLTDVTVLVLPENVSTAESREKLYDADDSLYLVKCFKSQEAVSCKTAFDLGVRPKVMERRGSDLWLGVIWLFMENGGFPIAVNVMSDWLKSRFLSDKAKERPHDEPETVHVELRVQQKKRSSSLKFNGPASHLVTILAALKELDDCEE